MYSKMFDMMLKAAFHGIVTNIVIKQYVIKSNKPTNKLTNDLIVLLHSGSIG